MIPQYYSLLEVSEKLNISTATLLRHINKGKIKGVKICGVWRIDSKELNRLLNITETIKPVKSAREIFNERNVRAI